MGDLKGRRRFSPEMYGLRTSDYGGAEAGGEEYTGASEPGGVDTNASDYVRKHDPVHFFRIKYKNWVKKLWKSRPRCTIISL